MDKHLRTTLIALRDGDIDLDEAARRLATGFYQPLPFATIDHHREMRGGFPEVVYCAGKTPEQAAAIARRIKERSGRVLATRADPEHAAAIRALLPAARHNTVARTVSVGAPPPSTGRPVLVVTAGTSDLPVAEEAIETMRIMGLSVERVVDVGVAGLDRVLAVADRIAAAAAVIVVAGMEGALASVVGGLARSPVIAVPTSVGYGAAFEGLAALLGMLNACSPGVVVVNIDNGFGAGFAAARFVKQTESAEDAESGEAGACA